MEISKISIVYKGKRFPINQINLEAPNVIDSMYIFKGLCFKGSRISLDAILILHSWVVIGTVQNSPFFHFQFSFSMKISIMSFTLVKRKWQEMGWFRITAAVSI